MKYPVFLQALALTIVVFLIGMYLGIVLEDNRMNQVTDYQLDAEVSLIDIIALNNLIDSTNVNCEELSLASLSLLDRIYEEAKILDNYENVQRVTKKFNALHKKYDVLRAYLWINSIKIKEKCGGDINTVVYLYNNSQEDLTIKAEQNVWSKILYEIKREKAKEVLLIPIDVSTDLVSLNVLLSGYSIERFPAVIVNEEFVFTELPNKQDVLDVLN